MDMDEPTNPYQSLPDPDPPPAPFAGRAAAFARLYQYLNDPASSGALTFSGWQHSGKTAFLRRCVLQADESLIAVYVPLAGLDSLDDGGLVAGLVLPALDALAGHDLTLGRLSALDSAGDDLRGWLAQSWLPALAATIRAHRQLLWLLDDAHLLVDAIHRGELSADTFAWLHDLLAGWPQLRLALSLPADREPDIMRMEPLADPARVVRLGYLTSDESAWLLQEPVRDLYTVTAEAAAEVHALTGGQPQWTQRIAFHLFRRWEADPATTRITPDDIRALIPAIHAQTSDEIAALWDSLSDNERLLLTAITQIHYDDPLQAIDAPAITAWLVETDYPLDLTAVRAGLRSLEYREIISQRGAQIMPAARLMQRWLLENARIRPRPSRVTPGTALALDRRLLALAVLTLLALILLIALAGSPAELPAPLPTATLVGE
jgi:hypothetical protein